MPQTATEISAHVFPGTRTGYVQVRFTRKPSEAVRDLLKALSFRWSRANRVWYGQATETELRDLLLKEGIPA